ncbi:PhzF family phenazine biosynthesis protein [Lentzea sp. JNUCC 0626]|uniref:PhzF family phenazine biosynthesis protein n=1 Tax=Lentzea sp. JNUCC 0626 TaxID=3367513 RepID=UPI00374862E3
MHRYTVVDVFTDTILQGNPVAVFFGAGDLSSEVMQRIAQEMNLSESTFVVPAEQGANVKVRIFTPVNELPFAGHPTLGTAVALGKYTNGDWLSMETGMGTITFELTRVDGKVVSARMRQPIPVWEPYAQTEHLLGALGLASSTLPVEVYRNGPRHVFVGLPDVPALSAIRPDLKGLAEHEDVAVNCFAAADGHWRARMFSPAYGVSEDAATGSAAGPLAVHLMRHGLVDFGTEIEIRQGVEMGRTSIMRAEVHGGPDGIDTVDVSGSAVIAAEGKFRI